MIRLVRVISALASILRLFSASFLFPIPIAFFYDEHDVSVAGIMVPGTAFLFALCAVLTLAASGLLRLLSRRGSEGMAEREGYLATGLGWLALPFFAMLPFLFLGVFTSPLDAYFEAMSGLTTTGFTLAQNLEQLPPSILWWRGFLQWLGGVGITVVGVALLANLTGGGFQLFQAEASAHASQRLKPKLAATARTLLGLYTSITLVLVAILALAMVNAGLTGKNAFFESMVHVFSGFGTGGFSSRSASIGSFQDPLVEGLMIVIMLLGATHFTVLLALRRGNPRQAWRDPEWRFFLGIWALGAATVVGTLIVHGVPWATAARDGLFVATSLHTGTGHATVDYSGWPTAAALVLFVLMFLGASSGSTGSGIKAFRVMLMAKVLARQLRLLVHPRAVIPIRIKGRTVSEASLATATSFMFAYLLLWGIGALLLGTFEQDFTAFEAAAGSAAAIGNVGIAFGPLGPSGGAAVLSEASRVVFIVLMWFGRLEIFTALLLFYPSSWRN